MAPSNSIYDENGVTVNSASGMASDIQTAVNSVISQGGIGTVNVPSGTFDFVLASGPWITVLIPAGVSISGSATYDASGNVQTWNTILNMPFEAASGSTWFKIEGNMDANKPSRFANLKLVGWRNQHQQSTTMYYGVKINKVLNFRVDHCDFEDMCESAIWIGTQLFSYNRNTMNGVIDHNRLVNVYGDPGFMNYNSRSLGYGIGMRRWACDVWEPLSNVMGEYTPYTVFIENNYFSRWRHCVASNDGFHYVFRHNTVENGYGIGEADGHGSLADSSNPYAVGTRCMEIYSNTFKNPDSRWNTNTWAINVRGGSAVIFDNTIIGYYGLIDLNNEYGNYAPYRSDNFISSTYIWNNNLNGGLLFHYTSDCVQNRDYFLYTMPDYVPYTDPFPLTVGTPIPPTPAPSPSSSPSPIPSASPYPTPTPNPNATPTPTPENPPGTFTPPPPPNHTGYWLVDGFNDFIYFIRWTVFGWVH